MRWVERLKKRCFLSSNAVLIGSLIVGKVGRLSTLDMVGHCRYLTDLGRIKEAVKKEVGQRSKR